MDPSFTYTVADLARDESVMLKCDCRVRTYGRAELAALVGLDARLHFVGLRRSEPGKHMLAPAPKPLNIPFSKEGVPRCSGLLGRRYTRSYAVSDDFGHLL